MLRRFINNTDWNLVLERFIAGFASGVSAGAVLLIGQIVFGS